MKCISTWNDLKASIWSTSPGYVAYFPSGLYLQFFKDFPCLSRTPRNTITSLRRKILAQLLDTHKTWSYHVCAVTVLRNFRPWRESSRLAASIEISEPAHLFLSGKAQKGPGKLEAKQEWLPKGGWSLFFQKYCDTLRERNKNRITHVYFLKVSKGLCLFNINHNHCIYSKIYIRISQ